MLHRSRLSVLAVAALVTSLFACCPFVSLVGSLMGMAALRRITFSHGALRGRRVAQCAIIMGLVCGAVSGIAWSQFIVATQKWMDEAATREVHRFVTEAQTGRGDAALRSWAANERSRPSADDVLTFGRTALSRYGPLRSFRLTSLAGAPLGGTVDVAGTFAFTDRELPGSASFLLEPTGQFTMPLLRVRALRIEDRQTGDLALGDIGAATRPAATVTSTQPTASAADTPSRSPE